ncbi:MAG: GGDEF domain-containing protein [Desulfobacterales bacterium]|nr:GGDEF domain-containing protein [Desulfobacterales bacterium]
MANLKQKLSPRVLQDLKKRSFAGIFIYTVALCVVVFADGYYFRHPVFSNRFIALITGICLFRLIHRLVEPRVPSRLETVNTIVFLAGLVLTALIWGIWSAAFMAQPGEMNIQLLMVICTIGICSGGCAAYSPSLPLSLAFNFSILWPGIFIFFRIENPPLAILFTIFSAYMALMSIRMNTEYRTALENEALLKEKTKDLEKLSNMDGLTGLYNRRYFDMAFEVGWQTAARNKTRLALIICDIDYFKRVNDEFGHLAGDEYLRTIARNLNRIFKRQTDIVARFGGEEFVILVSNARKGRSAYLAETFRQQMSDTRLQFESHTIRATVSLGLAEMIPGSGQDRGILIARADAMLYEAKNKGRNRVVVYQS